MTVSGGTTPYTFAWSNGAAADTATSLAPGTYTVTITDAGGCTVAESINIADSTGIQVSVAATNSTCLLYTSDAADD